jgi:hypothetical protein
LGIWRVHGFGEAVLDSPARARDRDEFGERDGEGDQQRMNASSSWPFSRGWSERRTGATRRPTCGHWAPQQGLAWDVTSPPDGERWGCRLEIYHDEPGQDMSEWETELAFKLAD